MGQRVASYEKRGDGWRAKVRVARVSESRTFARKAQAQEWAVQRERELRGGAGDGTQTMADAVARYLRDVSPTHRGERWERIRLTALLPSISFGGERLSRIGPDRWAEWRDRRLQQVAPGTVRRELGLISGLLEVARREWRWIATNPVRDIAKPPAPRPRTQVFSDSDVERLVDATGYARGSVPATKSQQAGWALLFALETAMRAGEICGLQRSNVDLANQVAVLPLTKNGDARAVPLSVAAVALLRLAMAAEHRDGPVLDIEAPTLDKLFRDAKRRTGLEHLTFHDSRATALTRLARKVDVLTLAKISGHRDIKMLSTVYYRESAADIARRLG